MRKHLLIITFALTACIAANAQSVSKDVAAAKATSFLQPKSDSQLQLLKSPYDNLYLFSIDGGGFVIVSADNHVQPILGYSLQSNLNVENLPTNLAAWLDSYDKQIRWSPSDDSYYDSASGLYLWYNTDVSPNLWQYWYEPISGDYGDYGWMEYEDGYWYIEVGEASWMEVPEEYDTSVLWHIE